MIEASEARGASIFFVESRELLINSYTSAVRIRAFLLRDVLI